MTILGAYTSGPRATVCGLNGSYLHRSHNNNNKDDDDNVVTAVILYTEPVTAGEEMPSDFRKRPATRRQIGRPDRDGWRSPAVLCPYWPDSREVRPTHIL